MAAGQTQPTFYTAIVNSCWLVAMPMFGRPATVARGKYKIFTFPLPTQNGSSMKTLSWTPCCSIGSLSWVRRICFPLYHCSARGEVMLLMEVFVLTASLSSVITATDPLHTDSGRRRDSEMFWQQKYTTLLMGVIANIIDDAIVHNIWVQTFKSSLFKFLHLILLLHSIPQRAVKLTITLSTMYIVVCCRCCIYIFPSNRQCSFV